MYISSETNFESSQDQVLDGNKITWYTVRANLMETQRERDEKIIAIKKQIAMGIIQPNGLPVGITPKMVGADIRPPQKHLLPQQQIQLRRTQQSNSNLGYLNKTTLSPQQMFQQRFGLRK